MSNDTQKPKKEIHIVFQVLNFLKSDHHSSIITCASEHLVLINLASHKGIKGICPSISLVARELKVHPDTVRRAIQKWQSLDIIEIEVNAGKCNSYHLHIPSPTPCMGATPCMDEVIHTPCMGATPPLAPVLPTPCMGAGIYNKEELSNNKKSFSMENEKKHDFAESMNQMAREAKQIAEHEERKKSEMTPCTAIEHIASIKELLDKKMRGA